MSGARVVRSGRQHYRADGACPSGLTLLGRSKGTNTSLPSLRPPPPPTVRSLTSIIVRGLGLTSDVRGVTWEECRPRSDVRSVGLPR